MRGLLRWSFIGCGLAMAYLVGSPVFAGGETAARKAAPIKIGMISSLFRDIPQATVLLMMQPFGAIMETQTGVRGELVAGGDAEQLGDDLAVEKVQLGVFHGIEFAWARQKHPELRPLCIAVNQQRYLLAHFVVRADSSCTTVKDLRAKTLALPKHTKEHCHLFLNRQCQETSKEPTAFFAKITNPSTGEEALDDVVDGLVQTTVTDNVTFECYRRRKPGRSAKLKTVETSIVFPAAVVAYKQGTLDAATLKRFREGMIGANQTILGRQMLTLWKLTGFEDVPVDYNRTLEAVVKVYPPPHRVQKQ